MHNRTPANSTGGNYAEAPPEKSKAISQPKDKQRIPKHRRGAGTNLVNHDSRREIQINYCSMKLVPWDARGLTGFIHRRRGIPGCKIQCRIPVANPDLKRVVCPIWARHNPSPATRARKRTRSWGEKNSTTRPNRND